MSRLIVACVVFVAALVLATGPRAGEKDKPKAVVVANADGAIQVISDRTESVPAFFQRHHVIVGGLEVKRFEALKTSAKPLEKLFLNYASYNDDKTKTALFGAVVTLAPMDSDVKKLLDEHMAKDKEKDRFIINLIVRRDAKDKELYHVTGVTTRSSVGFFDQAKRLGRDDFTHQDLLFKP